MLILFSVFFLPGIIAQSGAMARASFDSLLYLLQIVVVSVPQILLILYILELQPDTDRDAFGLRPFRRSDIATGLLSYGGLIGIFLPIGLIVALLPEESIRQAIPNVSWTFTRVELLPAVLIAMIAVGYREELFFRSYLITRLQELGVRRAGAVAVSTVLFALGHIYQGVLGIAVSLVIGALFGMLYVRRRNLHALAIAHALYNLTVLLGRYGVSTAGQ
jgi:hypothetical protein